MADIVETPLMKQYIEMKKKHPDAILLFRVGDFYETFSDDAIAASEILGITLTRRANGKAMSVELAGFPHHALDTYLPKLVRAGKRVAICEQLEDPKLTKKLVKRGITELVTPGVNTNSASLSAKERNFLAGVHFGKKCIGVAFLDITTGEFLCASGSAAEVDKLLSAVAPKELLRMHGTRTMCEQLFTMQCSVFELDDWVYKEDTARQRLLNHFSTNTLKGFGVEDMPEAVIAAGSLLCYLEMTGHTSTGHITTFGRIDSNSHVRLDRFTLRNLEILDPMTRGGRSLLSVLDRTYTPMGSRRLQWWLSFPELDIKEITRRHDGVEYFFRDTDFRRRAAEILRPVGDMERLSGRLGNNRISQRELWLLYYALKGAEELRVLLSGTDSEVMRGLAASMPVTTAVADLIEKTLFPIRPGEVKGDFIIASGVDAELDELRALSSHSKEALDEIQRRETEATGITSLKIGFNNVFGYYLEVRNTHKDKVPEEWIRRQTLVNAERYITQELKDYESKIIGAKERIEQIEARIYAELVAELSKSLAMIHGNTRVMAYVDCLLGFAEAAADYNYVRPVVDDSLELTICEGRHPVIERSMPPGEAYISNSVSLDCDSRQIMMLTGPNMSGKSALLRQTALIALMAQVGSFVPAESAKIGLVDKIFTRVGASDNISSGESTFMVEMNEAASILNNMSERSLILFDELGRGTSTYDGISIAWAIVEHIHENGRFRPKTLFATHYHELNEMESTFKRIVNYNVSVREINGKVVFVRKLERGGSAHSFGIHVARLAGMPPSIVKRADQVLSRLEKAAKTSGKDAKEGASGKDPKRADRVRRETLKDMGASREGYQMTLFQLDDPLLSQIRDALLHIDIDNLTPMQALSKLHDLQSLLTGKD